MLQEGETALYWAAINDRPEVIKLLLNYGAAVDIRAKVTNCHVNNWWGLECNITKYQQNISHLC